MPPDPLYQLAIGLSGRYMSRSGIDGTRPARGTELHRRGQPLTTHRTLGPPLYGFCIPLAECGDIDLRLTPFTFYRVLGIVLDRERPFACVTCDFNHEAILIAGLLGEYAGAFTCVPTPYHARAYTEF